MELRRLAPAAAALSAVLAVSACGASTPSSAPVSPTIRPAAFTPLTTANFGSVLGARARGLKSGHMTMSTSFMNVSGDFSYGPPLALQMLGSVTAHGRTIHLDMRLLGSVMYMQIPGLTPAGKFVSADLAKMPMTSQLFGLLKRYQAMGPQSMLGQFRHDISKVAYVGPTQIDGQAVRHYAVTVNTAAALKMLGSATSSLPRLSLPKEMTEQVYLNEQRLPVRIVLAMPGALGAMQIDMSRWGQPVHVTAPPATQVVQIPMGAFGGMSA